MSTAHNKHTLGVPAETDSCIGTSSERVLKRIGDDFYFCVLQYKGFQRRCLARLQVDLPNNLFYLNMIFDIGGCKHSATGRIRRKNCFRKALLQSPGKGQGLGKGKRVEVSLSRFRTAHFNFLDDLGDAFHFFCRSRHDQAVGRRVRRRSCFQRESLEGRFQRDRVPFSNCEHTRLAVLHVDVKCLKELADLSMLEGSCRSSDRSGRWVLYEGGTRNQRLQYGHCANRVSILKRIDYRRARVGHWQFLLQLIKLVGNGCQFLRRTYRHEGSIACIGFHANLRWQGCLKCIEKARLLHSLLVDLKYLDGSVGSIRASQHQLDDLGNSLLLFRGCDHDQLPRVRIRRHVYEREKSSQRGLDHGQLDRFDTVGRGFLR